MYFAKGDKVKLTDAALDRLYPGSWCSKARQINSARRFTVVGRRHDGLGMRVTTDGLSPNYTQTYHITFLEKA